jgi:hypothetical protein
VNWHDAADAKLAIHDFWGSEHGERAALGFSSALAEDNPNSLSLYRHLNHLEKLVMSRSEPIWVAPDIMDIVEVAQESFQPEPFLESDLITTSGFVLLPRAVKVPDAQGKTVTFRAFSWYPTTGPAPGEGNGDQIVQGVWMSFYSHIDDIDDEDGGYALKAAVEKEQSFNGYISQWVFLHGMVVPFGMSPTEWKDNAFRKEGYTDETMQNATESWWRFVQTLLRLSMQHLSERTQVRWPRNVRRRAQRSGLELDPEDPITVITLRRPRSKGNGDGEGEPVNWTKRWIVGAHWRNQWYPSLGIHRQIYIFDYVKGPEHLPLAVRKGRVWNFVR